jgi:predicted regulator of Ras-like GTPase activity (Roadblock/LC7/MglB family)
MEELFVKLNTTEGVLGSFVFSVDGREIYQSLKVNETFDFATISAHAEELGFLLDSLADSGALSEILLQGNSRVSIIRKEGNYFIVVIADNTIINVTALGVVLSSMMPKVRAALSGAPAGGIGGTSIGGGRHAVSPSLGASGSFQIARPPGGKVLRESESATNIPIQQQPHSNSKNTLICTLGDWQAGPIPADAVGIKFVNHFHRVCEETFGQSARDLLTREMKTLGVAPSTVNIRIVQDLIDAVGRYIEEPSLRRRFRDKVLGDQ